MKRKISIGIIGTSNKPIPAKTGGAIENYIFNLSKELIDLGYKIHIFSFDSDFGNNNGITIHNIQFGKFRNRSVLLNEIDFSINLLRYYNKNLKNQIDIFHGHSIISSSIFLYRNIRPFIFTAHGPTPWYKYPFENTQEKLGYYLEKIISRYILFKSDFITTISKRISTEILSKYKNLASKVKYIPNAINIEKFKRKSDYSNDNNKIILYVGRIKPVKRIEFLLYSIPKVIKYNNNIKFILIGPYNFFNNKKSLYVKKIEKIIDKLRIAKFVKFLGNLNEDELLNYYDMADIFVLPSFIEGLPTVLLEAMAKKIPIIATDIPGTNELIKNNWNGILVNPMDSNELSQAIINLLENKEIQQKFRNNGFKLIKSKYNYKTIAKQFAKIYNLLYNKYSKK
ncbi:MAG: glycosyltransferase family 4 protein [Candidatus Helarchaeota archaeon]